MPAGVTTYGRNAFWKLHPAAEEVEIRLEDSGLLTASANTSTVGPGYHIHICKLLKDLGEEFDLRWCEPDDDHFDDTGFFHDGDEDRVYDEMRAWLKGLTELCLEEDKKGSSKQAIALSIDVQFHTQAFALTPLGPRDHSWFERTAMDPGEGRDFFAWWNPGLDGEYFLGRALALMWTDIRWRAPMNEAERNNLQFASDSLRKAFALDPTLDYPWAEWTELLDFLGDRTDIYNIVKREASHRGSSIGYRREAVTVELPGRWWITLPGSFSNFLLEDDAFHAQDPPRAIWFTPYGFKDPDASFAHWRTQLPAMKKDFVEEGEDFVRVAELREQHENGHKYYTLATANLGRNGRSIMTVVFETLAEKDWALEAWRSLQPPQSPEGPEAEKAT